MVFLSRRLNSRGAIWGLIFSWVVGASVLTYPLILSPLSHIPRGSETVGTVPLFNLWTLQWNIDQLMRGYPDYWEAPIFASSAGSFAFSEPQLFTGLLATPLGLHSTVLAYNSIFFFFLILNAGFTYGLLRRWGMAMLPAGLGGLLVQAMPFIAQEMGVLQLVAIFGPLCCFFFLHRLLNQNPESGGANPIGLTLGLTATFSSCIYYGLFLTLFLPLFFLAHLRRSHFKRKIIRQLFLSAFLSAALILPFLWNQRNILHSQSFYPRTFHPARWEEYDNFLENNLLYSRLLGLDSGQGQRLFSGAGIVILAMVGFFGGQKWRIKIYLVGAIGLAFGLSFGVQFPPYQWIRDYLPGFAQLRAPFRFAMMVQLHLALLAAWGLQEVRKKIKNPSLKNWIILGVFSLVWFEGLAVPISLQAVTLPQGPTAWQSWLNHHHPDSRVVMLPFAPGGRVADFEQTVIWMLGNRFLEGEMINGYSGFFPKWHAPLRKQMLPYPTAAGIELLREKEVQFVIRHKRLPESSASETIPLPRIYEDGSVAIYSY